MFTSSEFALLQQVNNGTKDINDLDQSLLDKLYDYFVGDMPYGTAKARTGDPYEWIADHLSDIPGVR